MGGAEPQETPEQEREDERSREQIERGGITLAAERRLKELREGGGSFTSDLSVSGFALCHRLGLRPLSQVMGSSVYQVGYQPAGWGMLGGGVLMELDTLSEAWNEVRRRALNRLELEARHAGADAVVGVQINTAAHDWAEGGVEYAVVGTAVRREGAAPAEQPALTELSVSDFAKLLGAGVAPLGIVAWTSVFFVSTYGELEGMGGFGGLGGGLGFMENREMPALTQAVYSAREQTMERLGLQARQLGASGIVGVRVKHTIRHMDVGGANRSQRGLAITFDAIGTAVRDDGTAALPAPQTIIDLST